MFHQDFRGKVIDFQSLKFTGAIEQIHEEPEGLRISLPGNNFTPTATGVKTMFPIGGDLEITASYDLLRLDTPPKGTKDGQAGVFLYLRTANPQVAAMLSRFNRAEGPCYRCTRITTDEQGKRQFKTETIPTQALAGQLRLGARGDVVSYLVKEEADADFRELHKVQMPSTDLAWAQVTAETSDAATHVDVRIVDFQVRSGQLLDKALASAQKAETRPLGSRTTPVAVLIAAMIVSSLTLAFWLWLRKRSLGHNAATEET